MIKKTRTTERGYRIFLTFRDSHSNEVRVQKSSSARAPCVWLFCHGPDGADEPPHLTICQAKRLIEALTEFVEGAA